MYKSEKGVKYFTELCRFSLKYVQFSFDTGEIRLTMKTYLLISIFLIGLFSRALSKPNINEESQEPDELNRECPTIHGITTNLLFKVLLDTLV